MHCEFRGDRFTWLARRGHRCRLLTDPAGRPLAGTDGNRLVEWEDGTRDVVPVRTLRPLTDRAREAVRAGLRTAWRPDGRRTAMPSAVGA